MRESQGAVLVLDHVRGQGRLERLGVDARALEERQRRCARRRRERKRFACRSRQVRQPRADELVERLRNRERLQWIDLVRERARKLQREERIATGALVDPQQRLARERPVQTVAQEPMERAEAERPHRQPLDARVERLLDLRRPTPSATRRARSTNAGFTASLRNANASALDEAASSH
jgi:hypothetical protein